MSTAVINVRSVPPHPVSVHFLAEQTFAHQKRSSPLSSLGRAALSQRPEREKKIQPNKCWLSPSGTVPSLRGGSAGYLAEPSIYLFPLTFTTVHKADAEGREGETACALAQG